LSQDEGLRLQLVGQAYAAAARTFNCDKNRKMFVDCLNAWATEPAAS
jgi:hypothetical protein